MKGIPPAALPPPEFPPEQNQLSRRAAWVLTAIFLLLLGVPPLLDGLPGRVREFAVAAAGKGSSQPVAERLRGFDASVATAGFTDRPRQLTQQILTDFLGKGNDRVLIGQNGWLFYRPEIQALTGYGPLQPEPHSVSRDPALLDWEAPLEPIREFAAQLKERGVALWLVPVPMKPTIYPEMLGGAAVAAPVRHRDAPRLFEQLEAAGVRVIDPAPMLFEAKSAVGSEAAAPDTRLYLPDDTHWSSRGMTLTAAMLADQVKQQKWWTLSKGPEWQVRPAISEAGHGDLVDKLGLQEPDRWQLPRAEPLQVVELPEGVASAIDRASPVVVLGDSFVNIFDDAGLGFGLPGGGLSSRAGLAWHLAARLGTALDVHAVNGEGASGVRRWLGQRGETVVRSKKLVIWVIAERDLFLSRSVAKANRISWDRVSFAPDPPAVPDQPSLHAGPVMVEAEAVEKSDQADPRRANYDNALYTVKYEVRKVLSGPAPAGAFEVVHWHFKKRELQPTSRIEAGRTYRLKLEPWSSHPELQPINREELGEAEPAWWAESVEAVP
jgi:hypothetical protein